MPLTRARRYQLDKRGLRVLRSGHPWIFRSHLSSAASVFGGGQWLRLVDGDNRVAGWGIYEAAGAIGIRVLARGADPPDAAWRRRRVDAALARRAELRGRYAAFRAVHGESDGLPAVVVDVYGATAVVQTYSAGSEALGRVIGELARQRLGLANLVWKPSARRVDGEPRPPRVVRGAVDGPIAFAEDAMTLTADVLSGQKSGAFLDLRALRRWVAAQDLRGRRVLNLFSYTGTLGLAAEHAGAAEVVEVDASAPALATAARCHVVDAARRRQVCADVFAWLPALAGEERFDLILVDPPQMTSRRSQVPAVLAAYRRLYRAARPHLATGGRLVACCCTARVGRAAMRAAVEEGLGAELALEAELAPEPDHPVGFPEADYLKILIYGPRPD